MGLFDRLFRKGGNSRKGKKRLKRIDVAKRFEGLLRTGQGSMSRVFRTYDREIGRTVALKLLDKVKTKRFEERFPGLNKPTEGEICLAKLIRRLDPQAIRGSVTILPMAIGIGRGTEANAPLGRAVLGGLVAGLVTTLLVVPCLYSLVVRERKPATG